MLLYSGKHSLGAPKDLAECLAVDWACISSSSCTFLKASLDGKPIEDIWIGAYHPHTWWSNNGLLDGIKVDAKSILVVEVGPNAILRMEGKLEELPNEPVG